MEVSISGLVSDETARQHQEAARIERSAMSDLGLEPHQRGLYVRLMALEKRVAELESGLVADSFDPLDDRYPITDERRWIGWP